MSGTLTTIWSMLHSLPGPVIFVLVLAAVGIGFWTIYWFLVLIDYLIKKFKSTPEAVSELPLPNNSGLEFFPDRETLDRQRGYDKTLGSADNIDAIFATGRKVSVHDVPNIRRIKRVILPNPHSSSFIFYANSLADHPNLANYVISATKEFQDNLNIEVRWLPEMIHHSILIADSDKASGWVHVEIVLPYSKANTRPSFTLQKNHYEGAVNHFAKIFEKMWSNSLPPPINPVKPKLSDN